MTEDRILGTRVPDTPIHRASMWLEDLKFGERRTEAGAEPMGHTWEHFIMASEASFTAEQLEEAATYYGANTAKVLTGGRLEMTIPSPTGDGVMFLRDIFASLWLDAFMHGHATAQHRYGLSNQEIAEGHIAPGTRVEDNEGDTGTVDHCANGVVYVRGDAGGERLWNYRKGELTVLDE